MYFTFVAPFLRLRAVCLVLAAALLLTPALAAGAVDQPEAGAMASEPHHQPGGEVNIQLPDLAQGDFLGLNGHEILMSGLVVCVLGLLFGAWTYAGVKRLPVHGSMAEPENGIFPVGQFTTTSEGALPMTKPPCTEVPT